MLLRYRWAVFPDSGFVTRLPGKFTVPIISETEFLRQGGPQLCFDPIRTLNTGCDSVAGNRIIHYEGSHGQTGDDDIDPQRQLGPGPIQPGLAIPHSRRDGFDQVYTLTLTINATSARSW